MELTRRILSEVSNDYIPNDPYTASLYVKYGSKLSSGDFNVSYSYIETVIITAGAVFAAGLLSLLFYAIAMTFRCCCVCIRCLPRAPKIRKHHTYHTPRSDGHGMEVMIRDPSTEAPSATYRSTDSEQKKFYPWNCRRVCNFLILFLFGLAALAFDQLIVVGRYEVSSGVTTIVNAIDDFQGILTDITNTTATLQTYGDDLSKEFTAAESSCSYLAFNPSLESDISNALTQYNDALNTITNDLSPINKDIDKYQSKIPLYYSSGSTFFIIWALGVISVLFPLFFACCQRRKETMCSLWLVAIVFIIFVLIGFVWMVIVMFLGDLCLYPSANIVNNLSFSSSSQQVAIYYTSCVGNSSITSSLSSATGYVNYFYHQIDTALTYCPNDANLLAMQTTVILINSTGLPALYNATACAPVQQVWFDIVNTGICDEAYQGIFFVWGGQLISSLFLFLMLVTASITYQYFLPIDKMLPPKYAPSIASSDEEFLHEESFAHREEDSDSDSDEENNRRGQTRL